jgi:hypothetical protein
MRYIFYVAKGEVHEEWKFPNSVYHKRNLKAKEFLGLSELYIAHHDEVEYSATATSMACLHGFPIIRIKEFMAKNENFEMQIYREMLPVIVQLTKEIDIPYISPDIWARIREKVDFCKVPKGCTHNIEHTHIILITGSIEIDEKVSGPGHYRFVYSQTGKITGPAKYFQSDDPFTIEQMRESSRRLSDAITKGLKPEGPTLFDKALYSKS